MDANYYGRKYTWSDDGSKNLGDWGIRDMALSTRNNNQSGGMSLYDWRTGMPDPQIITGLGVASPTCTTTVTPTAGTGATRPTSSSCDLGPHQRNCTPAV